jgi:hypothetical protein
VTTSEQVDDRLTRALADNAALRTQLAERDQELAARDQQIAHLTKMLFARKSERLADANHPLLPFPGDEPAPPMLTSPMRPPCASTNFSLCTNMPPEPQHGSNTRPL